MGDDLHNVANVSIRGAYGNLLRTALHVVQKGVYLAEHAFVQAGNEADPVATALGPWLGQGDAVLNMMSLKFAKHCAARQ